MDDLSTAYDFTMRDGIADLDETDRFVEPSPMLHTTLPEALLDRLSAVAAVYEPARR